MSKLEVETVSAPRDGDVEAPAVSVVPPERGLSVHWRDLSVSFAGKQALAPCSGDVEEGEVVALMGGSGAGKTTLLNAISRRGPATNGIVWYSDGTSALAWSKALKRLVAYVEQDDTISENLTVRETLLFAARLRLPKASFKEKSARVDQQIALLRLEKAANTKLGSSLARGVSGGERKRCMIAQEMLTNPKLLCCDEPLSGLDSTIAVIVVRALSDLARERNVAVVASVHQPSSRIFLGFDKLILLDTEGVVYRGPTTNAGEAFAGAPFDLACPDAFSAPDWLMDVVVNGEFSTSTDDDKNKVDLAKRQARREEIVRKYGSNSVSKAPTSMARLQSSKASENYSVPYGEQIRVLFLRTWLEIKPMIFEKNAVTLHFGNACLAGLMWFQLQYKESDIWPRVTLSFAIPIAWVFFPLISSLGVVPANEVMLKKELSTNSYAIEAWFLVTTTTLLAPMFAQSLLHVSLAFALSNLGPIQVWAAMYCTVVLALLTFQSIGLFFSAFFNAANLTTVAMLFVTYAFLFTGIFVPLDDTPVPWIAAPNPMLYVMGLAMHSTFTLNGRKYKCGNNVEKDGTSFPKSCGPDGDGKIGAREIFREYDLQHLTPGICVGALLGFMIVARLAALLILKRRMKRHLSEQSKLDNAATAITIPTQQSYPGTPTSLGNNDEKDATVDEVQKV